MFISRLRGAGGARVGSAGLRRSQIIDKSAPEGCPATVPSKDLHAPFARAKLSISIMRSIGPTPFDVLNPVLARVMAQLEPVEVWLFGSRARGDARPDSDWDLLAVVGDSAPDSMIDLVTSWDIARASDVPVTLLITRRSDLAAIWGRPNTIGWDLAREGIRLHVG